MEDNILLGWRRRKGGGGDYYILTSHFLSAPGLNSKMCEGMHGGEKLGGHRVNPTQYVHMAKMAKVFMAIFKERNAYQSPSMAMVARRQQRNESTCLLWIIRVKVGGGFF